jgi:dTDP-4-dehydrorhamnose 3,5-epimerase
MKIISIQSLAISDVKVISFARFRDERGYFTEVIRENDLVGNAELPMLAQKRFAQSNESYSQYGTLRGLHLQVDPNLDKLVRVVQGRIIDFALDVRCGSPTFGKLVAYELKADRGLNYEEMVLVPFGFAHGFVCLEDSLVQYAQTGVWNGKGEVSFSFISPEIDQSLLSASIKDHITSIYPYLRMSPKDTAGINLTSWMTHPLMKQVCF